ncbi:hypothetical protein F5B21DRAFT_461259 [Xylaria acuta]|nr:hypothetical protein F5B21DRAFT_461259 [Xylaria acuta]
MLKILHAFWSLPSPCHPCRMIAIFAYFSNGTWNDLRRKVRELFPDRPDIVAGEDLTIDRRDLSTAREPIQRAEKILQEVGQPGFVSEDDMLRKFVESMYGDNE